jgi:HlyD family secretion protein
VNEAPDGHSTTSVEGGSATLRERVRSLRLPDAPAGPSHSRLTPVLAVLCLLLTASTGYLAYRDFNRTPADAAETTAPAAGDNDALKASAAASPTAAPGDLALTYDGYIIPAHKIQVSPKVSGMVVRLNIVEGQRVKKGEILAELEKVDYEADRDRARANLLLAKEKLRELENGNRPEEIEQAKAELEEMDAQRDQLYQDWRRNIGLKSGSALAQRDYELALSAYKAMDRRVEKMRQAYALMVKGPRIERIEQARAEVKQNEADLAKADWRLDNCTVRAPVSGIILTKKAEEGDIVNPVAFNVSASLCDMADLSDLEVDLSIQERDVAKVFAGQKCKVRTKAFPDRIYDGVVARLMPIADRAKGAVPVRVKTQIPREEEGVYLKPEMGATVTFMKKD